jgi:hypothetical protein
MLFQNKIITNKFYIYANHFVKVKRINKSTAKITLVNLLDNSIIDIPSESSDLLLRRIYTVGEVAKIVGRQPNTLRKYERKNLITSPKKFGEAYKGYKNWRYYQESDVYDIVEFFNGRVQGRPVNKSRGFVATKIKTLNQKVKLHK